jgi:hypothetical protein
VRQRPIKGNGYEGNSVAAGVLGIDEVRRPQDRGLPGGSVCGNGIQPMAGLAELDPRPAGQPIDREDPLVRETTGKPRARLPDPDCPTRSRHKKPRSTLRQGSSSRIRNMNQIRERNRMSPRHHALHTTISHPSGDVTGPGFNPPQHHTHVQHSCRCIHVDR